MTHALKLSVLYGHPTDPVAFESYYHGIHLPLAAAIPGLGRREVSKGLSGPDGSLPSFYRLFEAWFDSPSHLATVRSTPEWLAATADLSNFASGGVTVVLSELS
jgi:uncharacterized protein (TIGR02118 family)